MAFVLTWRDRTIQTIDGYDTIEEALKYLHIKPKNLMDLEYWEDTSNWKHTFLPYEIDLTKL